MAKRAQHGQRAVGKGPYPFAAREETYARYSAAQLSFARKDAGAAMRGAERDAKQYTKQYGYDSPMAVQRRGDAGWYADDVHTIAAEQRQRNRGNRSMTNCSCPPKGRRAAKRGVSITEWLRTTLDRKQHTDKANPFNEVAKGERGALRDAVKSGKLFAYYSPKKGIHGWMGNVYHEGYRVTNHATMRTPNVWFPGSRHTRIYMRFRAPWDQGRIWSGFAMGDGMYGRFKRTKLTDLYA